MELLELGYEASEDLKLYWVQCSLEIRYLSLYAYDFSLFFEVGSKSDGEFGAFFLVDFRFSDQQYGAGVMNRRVCEGKLIFRYFLIGILWKAGTFSQQMDRELRYYQVEFDLFCVFFLHWGLLALSYGQ